MSVVCLLTIAIIGKTNTGKTTLFNAATLLNAKISNFPFTTKKPNVGTAYVCDICVCRELGLKDNPLNSACIDGWRYVPIKLVDIPGLIKDAWTGRGLGNQFFSAIGQADALIHVVDASGSIDADGRITQPGSGNAVADAVDTEMEIYRWIASIIERNRESIIHESSSSSQAEAITKALSALKVHSWQAIQAIENAGFKRVPFKNWTHDQTVKFAAFLLPIAKPTMIIANKMDIATAEKYYEILTKHYGRSLVAACSAEAELVLRRAEKKDLLQYTPGQEKFRINEGAKLTPKQRAALHYIEKRVMAKWMNTGIQQALNTVVFKLLKTNMIYPVSDERKFADHHKNVLPDVHLMPEGTTPIDVARHVHSALAKNYILAIDAKTGVRLPKNYSLRHKDVIKIVTRPKAKQKKRL
ncbi:MAG: YchF-related putative GTPase [Candidatus Bathyarchaeota archaeon]|nr:YchF-related putative GTPase [Candidatus Bathyarchaeota archaeon]